MKPKELLAIRTKAGLDQSEFAALLGYDRYQTISEFERGKKPIPSQVEMLLHPKILPALLKLKTRKGRQ